MVEGSRKKGKVDMDEQSSVFLFCFALREYNMHLQPSTSTTLRDWTRMKILDDADLRSQPPKLISDDH